MSSDQPTPDAVLALVAGLLHELHSHAYDPARHPIDPAALHDAEQLLAGLDEQGITVTCAPPAPARVDRSMRCPCARETRAPSSPFSFPECSRD